MDRNNIIGFALLAALLIGYIVYNNQSQQAYQEEKRADSIANAKAHPKPVANTVPALQAPAKDSLNDSLRRSLPPAYNGQEQMVVLENSKLSLKFSTKGAYPVSALIKEYKTYDQKPLYLFNGTENRLSLTLPVNNGSAATSDLFFTPVQEDRPNGGKAISFNADLGGGKTVTITYSLLKDDYMMQCHITTAGMPANTMLLDWETQALHTEHDITNERTNSQVYYRYIDGDDDYFTITEADKESLDKKINWVGFRMHFFNSTLISSEGFVRADVNTTSKLDKNFVASNRTVFTLPVKPGGAQEYNLSWYIGPNHYSTLKSYKMDLDNMVPLGYGIMAFVKYINKWLIIPIFNVLSGFISNFGVIIMLMTIIIRLILSFFTYKSYLSAAKMRVLKPEIDELRAKHGDDQQKFGMEQMKLFRTAGVNPLGGCLPTLFQLPILFAMYYFFPSSIELRQEKFLWANDLSTYDNIATLPFEIPFYGDHVSLFTLLMTASSLFLALYNRNMTAQDPNNPMLKWMPYIFPFLLIGVFNKMAAALTFYYFFSNMISITQQFIIQKYIIDEKKIHAQIQENKNKPVTQSKWQQKLEEMQKAQANRGKQTPKKG
ncbi:MAG: membrane protein insertase YidC [Sphingobacteriales bacterium]|nr:MAG: membrane protein insertase YidC [Sphingobacteriales bacterium]